MSQPEFEISGHEYVTGTATIEPGTFTEPGQSEVSSQAGCTTGRLVEAVESGLETAWDSTRSFMSRYPMASCAVGIGLGILIGRLMSRRER